jgi:hypothetical protein
MTLVLNRTPSRYGTSSGSTREMICDAGCER